MTKRTWQMFVFLLKRPKSIFATLLEALRSANKVTPIYNLKYFLVFSRVISLLFARGFNPNEAMQLGILSLNFPKEKLKKFISKREMTEIQKTLNPQPWLRLTNDKTVFYTYCNTLGLPVPKLYALFFRHNAGHSTKGAILSSHKDWQSFINEDLPSEFIIKPANAAYGRGIMCFLRAEKEQFVEALSGQKYSAADICDIMYSRSRYDSFVIQERLINHPALTALSNTEYLQTIRLLSFVDKNGQSRILNSFFKPIVGKNIIDNHDKGKTGNLLAEIILDKGILKSAVKLTPNVPGITIVRCHPRTGIPFDGFRIPQWQDICDLAKKASLKFLPLRIIGWDIALTPNGPYIVEGNALSDPPNFFQGMDDILLKLNEIN